MIESPKHMTVMDLRDAFFTPFGAGDFTQDRSWGQIPRSPRWGFLSVTFGEVWGSCGFSTIKFPKSHWCQNLMSQISWKTLMLGRFFPTGFPTPNLRIWLKRWANRRDNTVAIFDMFQLKKARFLSRINRTRIPSDKKPPMIVPASLRFAPQIPSSIMREFEAEIRLRIQDSESPACPSNMALLFASYLCWVSFVVGEVYIFFLVTFKIPIKVLVLIEIPCAGERSSCRGTNCKTNLATQVDWVPS